MRAGAAGVPEARNRQFLSENADSETLATNRGERSTPQTA